jgi:hypothetical protein
MKANQRVPQNKFEGVTDRNFTTYNPQVVRDDVFMLGIDGTVKKNRMAVIRSSSAVVVSSQNQNREWVYSQQQSEGAHFFVCGDARRMAKDVDAALHKIIQERGAKTEEQTNEYVEKLKSEKRYKRDVY